MNFKKKVNGSWADTPHYIHKTDTDTITTLPTVIYPTSTTATVGLKGQTVQSSVPSPTSPVMPQGCGERTGNLAKYWKPAYVSSSGAVNTNKVNGVSFPVKLEAGQTVSFSNQKKNSGRGFAAFRAFDGTDLTDMIYRATNNVTYTATEDCYILIWGNYDNTTSMDETVFNLCGQMLNTGSTALPYEPFGVKIPISSANTTTPVYLGEVESTRKIKKLVLTGEENWKKSTTYQGSFYAAILDNAMLTRVLCTHAEYVSPISAQTYVYGKCGVDGGASTKNINLFIGESSWTVDDFKAYIAQQCAAGTPVTVWYVLAEPETGIVNEPLMKIGEYADEVSGITIQTITGKDTFDVETTLKPSEVSLAYTGWHNANVKEWDGSQWQ